MEDQRELQLLPTPSTRRITGWALGPPVSSKLAVAEPVEVPSLDLQLSINHQPIRRTSDFMQKRRPVCKNGDAKIDLSRIEALRWHSAEQIRLAAIEKAYAEQIRELTKREMELAQSEFVRARLIWKKVQEDVENAERQKARATHQIDSSCMEITCQACQQRFRP
ncbi:hypothetical protein Sjap_016506 [Stephania japonica]|uniref:Uncharacterized protein n=1 Tax=Stephania japonica TaxID=461633 RepID=A0AAP0IL47_9MAGN